MSDELENIIMVGEGVTARSTGQYDDAIPSAVLPDKVPGKHRWIVTAIYTVDENTVRHANDPTHVKYMDHESLIMLGLCCWDCERLFPSEITPDTECTGSA